MVAILFIQSGLDKIFNWKDNKQWLTGHFANSSFKGLAPLLLPVITVAEMAAGVLCALAFVAELLGRGTCLGVVGMALGMGCIVLLFLGQRVAKEYAGAASLVPYFLLCAAGLYVFSPC